MLAVTTFSLSTTVSAYSAATSNVTPRATRLLIEDTTTQNTLAVFVGSFLYSLVAIITLSMGAYGERGRVVLFATTLLVVLLIVVTLVRWIDYLLKLGRVGETTHEVEQAARAALEQRRRLPHLGGVPREPGAELPAGATPVFPAEIGYVQHIDMGALSGLCNEHDLIAHVAALPGTFVDRGRPLLHVTGDANAETHDALRDAFSIGEDRSFDQDPRFGLSVLAEVASRALSPGINDPGTAIDVIGRSVRLMAIWAQDDDRPADPPSLPSVHVPGIDIAEMFEDMYSPIARDGAANAEVQIRLQKAFGALARLPDPRYAGPARMHSAIALERARMAMPLAHDVRRVEVAAALVGQDFVGDGLPAGNEREIPRSRRQS